MIPNFYKTELAKPLALGGEETEVWVKTLKTRTDETVEWSDFSDFDRIILTINGESTDYEPEQIIATGIDSALIKFTGCTRGISAKSSLSIPANIKYHPAGSEVVIAFGSHNIDDLLAKIETGAVTSVSGRTGDVTLTKADVSLGNVDNTSDANKPVSSATQTALNSKQNSLVSGSSIKTVNSTSLLGPGDISITPNATHTGDVTGSTALTIANDTVTNAKMANMATKTYKGRTSAATGDPEDVPVATLKTDLGLVKADVGLGNVDNTSDATKDAATATLTNKRITKRLTTTTDSATATINVDTTDVYQLSAIANATTFSTTGTPTDGQSLVIRFKDAGVAKGLTWDAVFVAIGVTAPTTTVAGKWHYVGCQYNSAAAKWHILAVSVQA